MKSGKRLSGGRWILGATLALSVLAVGEKWPVLAGRVPFPARVVTGFPPWHGVVPAAHESWRHAELGDLATQFYPWHAFAGSAMKRGNLPLWNAHVLMGTPFAAAMQPAVFDPLNWLYALLSTAAAWSILLIVHRVLAGVFAALLCRCLGATALASVAGGVIFAFSGFLTAWQGRPQAATALWLPLILYAINRLRRVPSPASVALAGLAVAMPVLAGHPEIAFHVFVVAAAFALYRLLPDPRDRPDGRGGAARRFAALLAAAAGLGILLSGAQLLPSLEWLHRIQRGLEGSWGHRDLHEVLSFFSRGARSNPNGFGIQIPEGASYAGMFTLMVAPFALFGRLRRDALFFAFLLFASVEVVYGFPPAYPVSSWIPVLRALPNWRLLLVSDLSLAVLAALGVTAMCERLRGADGGPLRRWWLGVGGLAIVVAAVGIVLGAVRAVRAGSFGAAKPEIASAVIFFAAGALLAGIGLGRAVSSRRFEVLALGLVALDLVSFSSGYLPFVAPGAIFPRAPVFDFLRARADRQWRVASADVAYGSNFEMMYGLDTPGGYDFWLARTARLLEPFELGPGALQLSSKALEQDRTRILDLASLRYVVATDWNSSSANLSKRPDRFRSVYSKDGVVVFENLSALPEAFLVPRSGIRVIPGEDQQLTEIRRPSFDPLRRVVLAGRDGRAGPGAAADSGPEEREPGSVEAMERDLDRLTVSVFARRPAVLVISQAWYPGWKANVDGQEARLRRVDYAFTGLLVPSGRHRVTLAFDPASVRAGIALSAGGLALCVFLGGLSLLRRPTDRGDADREAA